MAAIPIWKDYIVDLGSTSPVMFKVAGSYIGKAYASATGQNVKIRINDIYAPKLTPSSFEEVLEDIGEFTPNPTISSAIYVQKSTDGGLTWVNVVNGEDYFEYDWSYIHGYSNGRNAPITGRVTPHTLLPCSYYNNGVQVDVSVMRGSTEVATIEVTHATQSNGSVYIQPSDLSGVARKGDRTLFERGTTRLLTYDVIDDCHRYALHYVNPFGGLDVFVPEGETKRSSQLTRHTHGMDYDNSHTFTFKGNTSLYAIEQQDKLTFVSGYLTDEQSERMQYLLASPTVYVHDMVENTFFPIIITDTNITEQTFKQNNRKMANYTINAEVALDKTRR